MKRMVQGPKRVYVIEDRFGNVELESAEVEKVTEKRVWFTERASLGFHCRRFIDPRKAEYSIDGAVTRYVTLCRATLKHLREEIIQTERNIKAALALVPTPTVEPMKGK